jgi:hypothetical protein
VLNPCCTKLGKQDKPLGPIEKMEAKIRDSARKVENQWRIPLPWRRDPAELPDNYSQVMAKLTYTDNDGIIRVGGRVGKATVSYDMQHPVLLPYGHWLSRLIVHRVHQFGHLGVAATAAKVRKKY